MEIIKGLILSNFMVHYSLMIVLIGVVIAKFFKSGKNKRPALIGYLIFLFGALFFSFLDIYYLLISFVLSQFWTVINAIMSIGFFGIFAIISIRNLKFINKKALVMTFIFFFGLLFIKILKVSFPSMDFNIFTSFFIVFLTLSVYIVIINFLINIQEK